MFPSLDRQNPRNRNLDPLPFNANNTSIFPIAETISQMNNPFFSKSQSDSAWIDPRRYGESQTPLPLQENNAQMMMMMNSEPVVTLPDDLFQMASDMAGNPLSLPPTEPRPLRFGGVAEGIGQNGMRAMTPQTPAEAIMEPNPLLCNFFQAPMTQRMATPQLNSQQYPSLQIQEPTPPPPSAASSSLSSSSLSSSYSQMIPCDVARRNNSVLCNVDLARRTEMNMEAPWSQHSNSDVDKILDDDDHSSSQQHKPSSPARFRSHQTDNWMGKFKELLDFRLNHGHCLVPNAFQENLPLAEWVKRQRYQYKLKHLGQHSTMSEDRIGALEQLGFVWNSHDQVWEERLRDLKAYKSIHGDCNVPSKYSPNPQLAIWVKRQRRQYKFLREGKTSTMTPCRINKLNELTFAWSGRKPSHSFP